MGITRPDTGHAERVSQYMDRLRSVDSPDAWFHGSFEVDPWSTAQELLAARDDAVANGWGLSGPGVSRLGAAPGRAAIGWRPDNQVMEGWIDLLLEGPDGFVLVDHKTYPGNEPEGHVRENYLGQMTAYRDAVLAPTGKPVLRTLIHFPALGRVCEIAPLRTTGSPEAISKGHRPQPV